MMLVGTMLSKLGSKRMGIAFSLCVAHLIVR
jgi:hypothetical protein